MTDEDEWHAPGRGERVRQALVDTVEPGAPAASAAAGGGPRSGTNGARVLESWTRQEGGRPVLYVVYRHPWWAFRTGLRRYVDHPPVVGGPDPDPAHRLADDIAVGDIGEPLGAYLESMVPDGRGTWWWGDEPLPGERSRRGPAPGAPT